MKRWEEVGLSVYRSTILDAFYCDNACRRPYTGEIGHFWTFYLCEVFGDIQPCKRETKRETVQFYTMSHIMKLIEWTKQYYTKEMREEEWEQNPGLDIPWYHLFLRTQLLSISQGRI